MNFWPRSAAAEGGAFLFSPCSQASPALGEQEPASTWAALGHGSNPSVCQEGGRSTGKGFSGKFSVQLNRWSYGLFIAFSFSFRLFRKIDISALGRSLSAGEDFLRDLFQG